MTSSHSDTAGNGGTKRAQLTYFYGRGSMVQGLFSDGTEVEKIPPNGPVLTLPVTTVQLNGRHWDAIRAMRPERFMGRRMMSYALSHLSLEIILTKSELRAELRVPITRRGTLGVPSAWFPCLIQDFSSKGFQIMSTTKFHVGDILELKCELYPERFLHCKIEVRHINDDCLGTKIVEVTEEGSKLCRQFIDEHISLKRFG